MRLGPLRSATTDGSDARMMWEGWKLSIWYNGNIILPAISWYIFYPWRVSYISCFDVFCYTEYKSSWQLHCTLRFSTRDLRSIISHRGPPTVMKYRFFGSGGTMVYALYLRGPYSTRWCRISRSSDLRLRLKLFGVVLACQGGLGCPNLETHLPSQRQGIRNRAWRKVPLQLGHCAPKAS